MRRIRRLGVQAAIFSLAFCGCSLVSGDAASPAPGVIKGVVKSADGKPLATFGGHVSGTSFKSGGIVQASIDGHDGAYSVTVGPGQFATRAWTDVTYHDHRYRIDLEPVDGKPLLSNQDTTNGATKDFVWRLDGYRAGNDERNAERTFGYHGGNVMLYAEGLDKEYQIDVLHHFGGTPEPTIAKDSTIELTLTPDGPLIDGSLGKPIVFAVKSGAVRDFTERLRPGIPIGGYNATAIEIAADGKRKPLRLVQFFVDPKNSPSQPAASLPILFVQTDAASENINRVDEIELLAIH